MIKMSHLNFDGWLRWLASAFLLACGGSQSGADTVQQPKKDVQGIEVTYEADGTVLHGYLAWDAAIQTKRPGILVVHEWWGHNEYVRRRARMLAELGYSALAIDMYGEGKNTTPS